MLAAANEPNGAYVLLFVVAAVVVLWPLYRWALRGLGYFFIVFGAIGLAVSLIGGEFATEPAILLGGGALLRLIIRRKQPRRHGRQGRRGSTIGHSAVARAEA